MRQIISYNFSAVETYYTQYFASFFYQKPKKNFAPLKILMLMVFCAVCQFAKAQEVVQASFSNFDYQGCVPIKIQFTDNSAGGPTSWFWDFGDGHTSTLQNPANTYTIPGRYRVKLIVKNAVSADTTFNDIIISGARADFSYTYTNICDTPAILNFKVYDPHSNIIYHWDFGNSKLSVFPNDTASYSSAGRYIVSLTTESPEGCQDSIKKVIMIGRSAIDFNAPAVICNNQNITFDDTLIPLPISGAWTINDSIVQRNASDLIYKFTNPGTYTIQLTAKYGTCDTSVIKQVEVLDKPNASFSMNGKSKSCTYPDTIQFINTSINAISYKWYFGDGQTSTEENPTHIYNAGRFSPMLVAYNANGCTDTLTKTDSIFLGGAIINSINLPDSGCIPHPVTFIPDIAVPDAITGYSWDFGDGETGEGENPIHTYSTPGRYNVSLTVTTAGGCTTTLSIPNAVAVGTRSAPDFTVDKTILCDSERVQFSGTASGPVTNWYWNIGGRNFNSKQNIGYYFSDTGYHTVTLTVNNGGCLDSMVKPNLIYVNPPFASYTTKFNCNNTSLITFVDRSIGAEKWLWNFGDSTTSTEQNPPTHNYTNSGKYVVSLTTANKDSSCTNTYKATIYVLNTKPDFTFIPADGQLCRKENIQIGVSDPDYVLDYLWSLGDGRTLFSDTSINVSYSKTGTYYPSLIARYQNGCQDTLKSSDSITVTGPTASLGTALPAVCLNDTTTFIDNSISDGTHTIINRVWSFGDGITESKNNAPYKHLYAKKGYYIATLSVKDDNNCADTATYKPVIVNALPAVSAGPDTFVCDGSTVQLQPSGALSYVWNTSSTLSCLSCTNPSASPLKDTSYVVTGTDANSCKASDTVRIVVVHPQTLTIDHAPREICATKSVQLIASGTDLYSWSPMDGLNNPTSGNPVASPGVTTTYYVTGMDSKKCFSKTDSVKVIVHPNPDVTIVNNALVVEKGSKTLINTTGSDNIQKWFWDPSQGLSCNTCPQPILWAQKSMTYTVKVQTDFGCSDTAQLTVHVLCDQSKIYIPSAFTPNGDGKNDRFYVISSIDNPVRAFVIYNRAGEMIFSKKGHSTNYSADGWDGTYRGIPVPPGTYVYHIEVMCNDAVVPFTGTITLIR
jgi:gliding motility-associated-like protein